MKNFTALDLGAGSAIQAETLSLFTPKRNILCADIDKEALEIARKKGFRAEKSDLFKDIKNKFDVIVFNAPYLPESEHDNKKDTTGGKLGDETILKFLKKLKSRIEKDGMAFLLLSSFTPRKRIEKEIKRQGLKIKKTYEKKIFFEKLEILLLVTAPS